MRIGIKVGSSLFVTSNGHGKVIDDYFVTNLMAKIAKLINRGHEVFLVSSGAVASDLDESHSETLRAAIGQPKLMALYRLYIQPINVAQILLVADDLNNNRQHIVDLLKEAFAARILPVINANDAVNGEELNRLHEYEDNDRLFASVCLMLKPDVAIIVTDVDGIKGKNGEVIHCFNTCDESEIVYNAGGKDQGTGGMASKAEVGKALAQKDIRTIIVNGYVKDFVWRSIDQLSFGMEEGYTFGTSFVLEQDLR